MTKQHYSIGQWVLMLLVAGGLYLITGSFFMALGVLLVLIVIDFVLVDQLEGYQRRKSHRKDAE